LDKQKQLMDEEQTKVASLPTSNRFHYHDVSSVPYSKGLNPNNMQHGVEFSFESSLSDVFNNGGSSFGMADMFASRDIPIMPYIQNSNGGLSFGMVDMPIMSYSQNSDLGLQQGINRGVTISVAECSSSSPHMFGYDGKISEAGPNVDNASATPITNAKSTLHSVNESVMDYPYTYLNESLSREFSLSNMPDYLFSSKSSLFCFYVLMCVFE
jgi:hypothetical protein